jgi:hypothetical protein
MINFINTVSSDYKSYETKARELTDLKKKNIPLPIGSYGQELNLDHVISIKFGYEHNIPVSVICRDDNLQWISREDNLRKGSKLTEKSTELLKLWYDNNGFLFELMFLQKLLSRGRQSGASVMKHCVGKRPSVQLDMFH